MAAPAVRPAPIVPPWYWRLAASSVWLGAASLVAVLFLNLLLRPEGGLLLALGVSAGFVMTALPLLAAQRAVLLPSPSFAPRLASAYPTNPLAESVERLLAASRLFLFASLSGGASVRLLFWWLGGESAACATASGVAAGITHSVWMYFGGGRVAPFPPIPRSRWSHCKQLVPSVARKAAQHMVITLVTVCCVLAASGHVNLLPLSVVAWMQLCVSTWLFACAALFGRHMLAVVHTERLRFLPVASDPDSAALTQPLRAALTARYAREDQFGLHLAFEDLCFVAEKDAARRHAVFADKTGASWSELCKAALRPVGEAVSVIAEVLQSESARGSAKQRLRVRAHLAANQQLLCWSVRALASLGHASRSQDRYGWAQLREPMVGEVLSMLLSLHLALRAWEASFPPPAVSLAPRLPRAAPEPAAVVADVLHVGIATLARGAGSLEALRASAAAPLFGSRGEQERCLAACG